MSTQIENLVISFNEILLHTGNLFDELILDKTSNLLLPNNNRTSTKLNTSIKTFDSNLDRLLVQLNDISLFDAKLKQRVIEREQQKSLATDVVAQIQINQPEPQQPQEIDQQNDYAGIPNQDFANGDILLNDISDFLSTVPDAPDLNMNGDFNENLNQLLMESGNYGDNNNNDGMDIDLNSFNTGLNDNNNDIGGDLNLDIDNNLFNEIDSMLNL